MQSLKNWLISKLLERDKLVAVPQSWQKEYVKLAADKVKNSQALDLLVNEYNTLLLDYYKRSSVKELKEELEKNNISFKATASKEELINILHKEFKMLYEKN